MDPHNFDLSKVSAWPQVQRAVSEEQQAGQAGTDAFEQHINEARAVSLAIASEWIPSEWDHLYPHVCGGDRNLIQAAIQARVERRKLKTITAQRYARALYRLANDLGKRGQALEGTDDRSLIDHKERFFNSDKHMRSALAVLNDHRDPLAGASSVHKHQHYTPSAADEPLIEALIKHGAKHKGWSRQVAAHHAGTLCKLSNELRLYQAGTLAGSGDAQLSIFAGASGKVSRRRTSALMALREYREARGVGPSAESASGSQVLRQAGKRASSPMMALNSEEFRELLDDQSDDPAIMADDPALLRLEHALREEIQGPAQLPLSIEPEGFMLNPAEFPAANVRRLLDDQPAQPTKALNSKELLQLLDEQSDEPAIMADDPQLLRLEHELREEIQGQPDDQPAQPPLSIEPEGFTLNPVEFPPAKVRRLLNDQTAQPPACGNPKNFNAGDRVLMRAPLHELDPSQWEGQPTMQDSGRDYPAVLGKSSVLPSEDNRSTRFVINTDRYTALLVPARLTGQRAPVHPPGAAVRLGSRSENIPKPGARPPSTAQELHDHAKYPSVLPRIPSHAQIGALGPTASFPQRGLVLDDTEWLGDEHILRDYQLLEQALQGSDPALAARTRFVDPLIAFQLSWGAESDALRALQRIVYDQDDNDVVDFLFVPVNDASATDPNRRGTHWSLLLVDRRTRGEPVAYHYDSARGHNDGPAEHLAERLGVVTLQRAGMAQQQNRYDCGVFVVDSTRELVRRLAQGERPQHEPLHLDYLAANRQALRDRLDRDAPSR